MRKSKLRALASQFHQHLQSVKSQTPLQAGLVWYPWASLAAFEILDQVLKGDLEALRGMIGRDPVLDVGCGDGDVAFFLESLGARVDAIDHAPTNYNAMVGVRVLKQVLQSKVGIHAVDLDARPRLPGSNYGLTILLGVLYHLKNPFLVLETLARHSRHMFLSTRIASLTPDRKFNFGNLPMAYLVEEDELNQDPTNFWIFSEAGLKRLVRRAGWDVVHYTTSGPPAATADPVTPQGDVRAYILAESRLAAPACGFHIQRGWHDLEHHTWRWTDRQFSFLLDVPEPLAPATLRFLFHLPEETIGQRPEVTLSATVNGARLAPATYSTPGEHEYQGAVPSLPEGPVTVEFELDKTVRAGAGDQRELGILVDFSGAPPVMVG